MKRRDRIKKVQELRQKALDEQVNKLNGVRAAEEEARRQAEAQHTALTTAFVRRQALEQTAATAQDWQNAQEWLTERIAHKQVADLRVQRAAQVVHRARQAVLAARNDVKRLEILDQNLARQEQTAHNRAESRQHDEIAQQRSAARPSRS